MILERPDFIDRDPQAVEREAIALYEELLQKTLFPAQPERLLINVLALRESLVRLAIQDGCEQNLVNYARGVNLDQLGAVVGAERLAAQPARTTLQFTKRASALNVAIVVPVGTMVSAGAGLIFATDEALTIGAGVPSGTVGATATVAGTAASGLPIGSVTQLVSPINGITEITNTIATFGGTDPETDDRYRERIKLAPNQFSVAGPTGAYRFFALSADTSIVDVAVLNPVAIQVKIYPLIEGIEGTVPQAIEDAIMAAVNPDDIRPLCDEVEVLAPTAIATPITATITPLKSASVSAVTAAVNTAAAALKTTRKRTLGQDLTVSQVIEALHVDGVYKVAVSAPAADVVAAPNEFVSVGTITLTIATAVDG